jgi:hypothetical protein
MPEKKAYITILGRSSWAVLNTYYAALMEKAYYPDNIYIFAEDTYSEDIPKIIEGMKILSAEFDFNPKIKFSLVEENDFITAVKKIGGLIKELKRQNYSIAIDITSGRKILVAAALIPAVKLKMSHVFYLAVKNLESKPYMMIPLANQQLRDFAEEVEKGVTDGVVDGTKQP